MTAARLRLGELKDFKKLLKIQEGLVKSLERTMKKLEQEIKLCVNSSEELRRGVEKASTIPGVALITAATVLGECGPLRNYKSRQLGSYSGLAPRIHSSGTSVRKCRISKRGPGKLRRVLYMAAMAAIEKNSNMRVFYERLIAKGKKPMQARCAVMHKILILIRAVVVNDTDFDENFRKNQALRA